MIEMLALGILLALVFTVASIAVTALKLVIWSLLLPLRLLLKLLLLPLLLLKALIGGLTLAMLTPVFAVLLVGLVLAAAVAVLIPLMPVLVLGALIWLIVRATRRPAFAR